ncbi:MAG: preprotein translocase subunit SecG [Planctomycetota bacterium]|nr:preprotein translocase subunit SecG [Planctomycetota bacterium]
MIESILWVLFTLGCILVSAVILLQEGKGGGLAEAFGGGGAQTFGVKAEGITKFTAYLCVGIVLIAILITNIRSSDSAVVVLDAEGPGGGAASAPSETGEGEGQ